MSPLVSKFMYCLRILNGRRVQMLLPSVPTTTFHWRLPPCLSIYTHTILLLPTHTRQKHITSITQFSLIRSLSLMEDENQYKKGLWTEEEDRILMEYVRVHGRGKWNRIPKVTGLKRCGKSCRLRWMNYLSPNVKHGDFSLEEEELIIRLHKLLGNRWSLIAGRVPGRTDNQVKNHWNSHLCKKIGIVKEENASKAQPTKSKNSDGHEIDSNSQMQGIDVEMNEEPQNAIEAYMEHAPPINEHCFQSSWLDNGKMELDHLEGLMGFQEGYSLDLIWQEL